MSSDEATTSNAAANNAPVQDEKKEHINIKVVSQVYYLIQLTITVPHIFHCSYSNFP